MPPESGRLSLLVLHSAAPQRCSADCTGGDNGGEWLICGGTIQHRTKPVLGLRQTAASARVIITKY
jgi:hypothetical protein